MNLPIRVFARLGRLVVLTFLATPSGVLAAPAQQAYLKASNTEPNDNFGLAVDISGDTIVVGSRWEASNAVGVNGNQTNNDAGRSGAAYVFVRHGTHWSQQAYLKASNAGGAFEFGRSVAVSGDTLVVGSPFEPSNATGVNGNQYEISAAYSGAVYVFVRSGTNWNQQAYLKASNTGGRDYFGWSVAISGDTVLVGAYGEDSSATDVDGDGSNNDAQDAGAAYVFERHGTNWSQAAYLKASNAGTGDHFGYSVAVSGATAVVGASAEDSAAVRANGRQSDNSATNSGAAYVFVRRGTNWSQQAYLKASNTSGPLPSDVFGNFFGVSVAISSDTIVVGSHREDSKAVGVNGDQTDRSAPAAGAAYVFVRDGTNWSQQAYLKASNTGAGDYFGIVAVSGDTVVVGAPQEASSATGVNGDQTNDSAPAAGAAYVFERTGTNWSQQAYLKASNPDAWDQFGVPVALSGDTLVVGAFGEASNATGVNGNQTDNNGYWSGAAYVFTGLGVGPRLAVAPDERGGYFIRFPGAPFVTYRIERTDLGGTWQAIGSATAPASGLVEFRDTNAPSGRSFYRTAQP